MMMDFRKPLRGLRSTLVLMLMTTVSLSISSQSAPAQQTAPPVKTGPSPEAMESFQSQIRDLRQQAGDFRDRARTAQESLRSIKEQMMEMGLDMRLDVRETEARMTYLVDKIDSDIEAGDAVTAEADLLMAGYAADFIERFLGRR